MIGRIYDSHDVNWFRKRWITPNPFRSSNDYRERFCVLQVARLQGGRHAEIF